MTIYGWDMSHYDAASIGGAVGEGFVFITHKAGGDDSDAELDDWWAGVRKLGGGVLLGAYWVLLPGNPVGRADAFLNRLDAACPGWRDRPFILQVDCEKWGGDASTVPSKAEIKAFCDRLVAKVPKLRPIVYAPEWVYGDRLAGLGYPLWASSYVTGSGAASKLYPGDGSSRWHAYSGQTPAVLQFTSSATIAGQTTCDANAFRGSLAQLTALVAPGWDDDVEPIDLLNYDPNDPAKGVPNAFDDKDKNPTVSVRTALYNGYLIPMRIEDKVEALAKVVAGLATGAALEADVDALKALIGNVDDQVIARLVGGSAQETADRLRAALGDQAVEVGRILAGV